MTPDDALALGKIIAEQSGRATILKIALENLADAISNSEHDHSRVEDEPCEVCAALINARKVLEIAK